MNLIINKKVNLIKWLRGDDFILQHVQSKKLITMDEYQKLKSISDPGTLITDLLDLMVQKGDRVCVGFLDLLNEDDVNESSPELRDWIKSVKIPEIKADSQHSTQSSGSSVNITGSSGSSIGAPVIIGAKINSLNINTQLTSGKTTDVMRNDRTQNSNPRITDYQGFLKTNRSKLIDKVKVVDRIVDVLGLADEMAANVRAEKTDQAKMRKLLDYTTTKSAARRLFDALNEHAADVMEDLA
ncbi:uncharacterized protein LOC113645400 [Tachysurus fulvidraco]|uniref:uncharacterized protein LOC113645400 n=1 Tax=Tachysurus fulvidraco TaxID=1234273 RepID=UPI001FED710A|nr:uncharacterized protein LOC113645400 [Tachysurus fulvidraco]